tara:strand:- start:93 stop:629 length:537 start_codon:yes stop_codon:yes gene_type:complete
MAARFSAFLSYPATVFDPLMARLRRTLDGVQGSPRHNLRVWGLICIVLLASLTQAGVPLALNGAGAKGPGSLQAASDIIYICTGSGIQPVRLSTVGSGVVPVSLASETRDPGTSGKAAPSHAFCAHCAFCHTMPVITASFTWTHLARQTRLAPVIRGSHAVFVATVLGFAPRGPPLGI